MKFITPLSKVEEETLREAYCNHPNINVRERAQALLLNNRGYLVARLCEIFEVRHETAGSWLKKWEKNGLRGLYDLPRKGRPPIFSKEEKREFIKNVDKNPHQRKKAALKLQKKTGKTAHADTFKRILKKQTTAGNGVAAH